MEMSRDAGSIPAASTQSGCTTRLDSNKARQFPLVGLVRLAGVAPAAASDTSGEQIWPATRQIPHPHRSHRSTGHVDAVGVHRFFLKQPLDALNEPPHLLARLFLHLVRHLASTDARPDLDRLWHEEIAFFGHRLEEMPAAIFAAITFSLCALPATALQKKHRRIPLTVLQVLRFRACVKQGTVVCGFETAVVGTLELIEVGRISVADAYA